MAASDLKDLPIRVVDLATTTSKPRNLLIDFESWIEAEERTIAGCLSSNGNMYSFSKIPSWQLTKLRPLRSSKRCLNKEDVFVCCNVDNNDAVKLERAAKKLL